MSEPNNVLDLAGIALADLIVHVSAGQYVPTLHTSTTSRWSGTKIDQLRFGTFPNTGLVELARTEALVRAPNWGAWAFGFVGSQAEGVALIVEAGGPPLPNLVRVFQDFRPPNNGFSLIGDPRFYLRVQDTFDPIDAAQRGVWANLLEGGINRVAAAKEIWRTRLPPQTSAP